MFTQNKEDRKRVEKALDISGFPSGKVSVLRHIVNIGFETFHSKMRRIYSFIQILFFLRAMLYRCKNSNLKTSSISISLSLRDRMWKRFSKDLLAIASVD